MTRASFAGVSPRESRTSSARETLTSTSLSGELGVLQRHRLGRDLEVEAVRDDEPVDHVEVGSAAAVHADDAPLDDDELGLRVVRPVRRHEAELRKRRDELLAAQVAPCA